MFKKDKTDIENGADETVTITKEGSDKIKMAREAYEKKIKTIDVKYKRKHEGLLKLYGEGVEKSKLKFWAKSKTEDISDPKYWVLVNAQSIKDFIKYGSNKVLDQIRIRTQASIEAREAVDKILKQQKPGLDAKQVAFTLMIVGVVAVMAYVMISQFMNFNAIITENIKVQSDLGKARGNLAACQTELSAYNPTSKAVSPPTGDNTLDG